MQLNVKVEQILYPKETAEEQAGWYILRTDQGKVSGKMLWRPEVGELLTLDGQKEIYRGELQFKFASASPNVPAHPSDLLAYVCERANGIGPAMLAKIWDAYGENWEAEIALSEMMGPVKAAAFSEALNAVRSEAEKSKAVAYLMGKGATSNMAVAAWEVWKRNTIGVVQGNCYRLSDLPNYGFKHVDDRIRHGFGIVDDDPRRIRAAVVYALKQLTENGSTVIDWPELRNHCMGIVGGYSGLICEQVKIMFANKTLIAFKGNGLIALRDDYDNEIDLVKWIDE